MGRGTTYYTIYHTGGKTHILAYGEYDAIAQFRKNYPQLRDQRNRRRCALNQRISPPRFRGGLGLFYHSITKGTLYSFAHSSA